MAPRTESLEEAVKVADSEWPHLERLSAEIDKFEKNLAVMETRLRPVIVTYPESEVALVDVAPDHEFHVILQRLANANDAFDGLINRVRL